RVLLGRLMKLRLALVFAALFAVLAATAATAQGPFVLDPAKLKLASANALVIDTLDNRAVYTKAANEVTPIASLTKLMTAIVTLEAGQPLDEPLAIDVEDLDFVKGSHSRLRMGRGSARRAARRAVGSVCGGGCSLARGGGQRVPAARNAAARVDVIREPRRIESR